MGAWPFPVPPFMKLLIIDDNEAIRQVLKQLLRALITRVWECDDGADALLAYRQFLPTHNPQVKTLRRSWVTR
jgi:CheY-like chemotaxis protein